MTRISVVSDAIYPWHVGGKEVRYHEILSRLGDHYQLRIHTMRWWGGQPPVENSTTYHSISPRLVMYRNGKRSIRQGVVFALCCLRLLWGRHDLIEADHMPYLQLFTLKFVAAVRRVPLVVTWHEVWGEEYWISYLGRLGRIASGIEKLASRLPDHIVAVSKNTADRLVEIGVNPVKIHVVPNGVSAQVHDAAPSPDATELVVIGRLIAHKRIDLCIDILSELHRRGRNISLTVIGEGPDELELVARANTYGLLEHVRFVGALEASSDVWSLVSGAAVVLAPSEREGFGMAVAEALSLGIPVVTSDHLDNSARLLVSDDATGSVVEAGNTFAFADAVEYWLDRACGRTTIRETFQATHPELDWDDAANAYAQVYEEALS
jgi:glycosyltransferase involved in cell wall biosynthesis